MEENYTEKEVKQSKSRKRIFYLVLVINIALAALVVWQVVTLLSL